MNVDIRYQPAFATLFIALKPGDSLMAESGTMASMSQSIRLKPRLFGGLWVALLRRILGRESLFINQIDCVDNPGEIVLSPTTPGDVQCIELHGNAMFLQPGSFIACGRAVKLSVSWAGFSSLFSGEGLFRLKVSGFGHVWFGAYGQIWVHDVQGEYVVDSGHLLAYEPTVTLRLGLSGAIFSSMFGGEGLVARLQGQGRIYLQSRHIDGLASWTNSHL
jgi:uncharacterized protein (TIGR00266 family)